MRVLRAIVEPATDLLATGVADLLHRRRISAKPVGDDLPRSAVFLHDPLEKLQRRSLVPLRSDHCLQNLALMIDGAPEIAELAVDLHKHLVQMPTPLRIAAHARYPLLSDLGGEHRTKPVPPKPDGLIADVDPALGQEIFDVAQRQLPDGFARPSSRTPAGRPKSARLEDLARAYTVAIGVSGEPTELGRRNGGAVKKKAERPRRRSQAASSAKYQSSPR